MFKISLFADQGRKDKLNQLGFALQVMEQHADLAAHAAEIDLAAPRPAAYRCRTVLPTKGPGSFGQLGFGSSSRWNFAAQY